MRRTLETLLFLIAFQTAPAGGSEVVKAGRWELHSSFWMNLHQTLMHDASTRAPRDLDALSEEERATWMNVVAAYREAAGEGSITFSDPTMELQDVLTQVSDGAVDPMLRSPLASAILEAAPIYRAWWWSADDRANRFFIGYVAAMLRDAGEDLIREHERVYGGDYPDRIRVDAAAYGGAYGAYSHPLKHGLVITISSRDTGNHGLTALEIVLHESSHSIVFPRYGRTARAIAKASAERGIDPPDGLWHAILFATSSELTRRALAERGLPDYVPMADDLLTRAWPQYREPIETFWYPYLDGNGTLENAVANVVRAIE